MAADDLFIPVLADFLSFHGLKLLFETVQRLEEDLSHQLEHIFIVVNAFNQTFKIAHEALDALRSTTPSTCSTPSCGSAPSSPRPRARAARSSGTTRTPRARPTSRRSRSRSSGASARRAPPPGRRGSVSMRKAFDANVPKLRPRLKAGAPGAAPERNGVTAAADEAAEVSAAMQAAVDEQPPPEVTEAADPEPVRRRPRTAIPTRAAASTPTAIEFLEAGIPSVAPPRRRASRATRRQPRSEVEGRARPRPRPR